MSPEIENFIIEKFMNSLNLTVQGNSLIDVSTLTEQELLDSNSNIPYFHKHDDNSNNKSISRKKSKTENMLEKVN